MWRVAFTLLLVSATTLGSPLKFKPEVPIASWEVRTDSETPELLLPPTSLYERTAESLTYTTGSDVMKSLRTQLAVPEVRERVTDAVTEMLGHTTTLSTMCPEDFRATLFVALLHVEGNLVADETLTFKRHLVTPLVETLDTKTQTIVYDVMTTVTKTLLQTPVMDEINMAALNKNKYLNTLVRIFHDLKSDLLKPDPELRTVEALKTRLHSLMTSVSAADDCSLLVSRQQMLALCDKIITRLTSPAHLESALRMLHTTLTPTLIKDATTLTYLRDVLETLATKYVTLMTYTVTSLETLVRTDVRPAALIVDWIYCLTLPTSHYPTLHSSPAAWRHPYLLPVLSSPTVPPTSPLTKVILTVRQGHFPILETRRKMEELKQLVLTEVHSLRLPKETDDCYRSQVAATNALLTAGLHLADKTLINSTLMTLMEQLVTMETSKVTPTLSIEIIRREVARLTEKLLKPEHEVFKTLFEVPELHSLFTRTNLLELLTTPLSMTTADVISRRFMTYFRSATDIIMTTRDLCTCDVREVNTRIERIIRTVENRLTLEVLEPELTAELLTFCATNGIPITNTKLTQLIRQVRPTFTLLRHHQRHLVTGLETCVTKMTFVPDVLVNLLLTLKVKLSDLELFTLPGAPLDFFSHKVAFPDAPIHPYSSKVNAYLPLNYQPRSMVPEIYKPYDLVNRWDLSEVRTLPLPSKDMPCFRPKFTAYNALLTTMLHEISVSALHGFLKQRLLTELSKTTPEVTSDAVLRIVGEMQVELIEPEQRLLEHLLELPELKRVVESARVITALRAGRTLTFSDLMTSLRADLDTVYTSHALCNLDLTLAEARLQTLLTNMDTGLTLEKFESTLTSVFRQRLGTSLPSTVLNQLLTSMRPTIRLCLHERRAICELVQSDLRTQTVEPTALLNVVLAVEEVEMGKMNIRNSPETLSLSELKHEIEKLSLPTPTETCYRPKVTALRAVLTTFLQKLQTLIVERTLEDLVELPFIKNILLSHSDVITKEHVIRIVKQEVSYTVPEVHVPELRRLLEESELLRTVESTHRPLTLPMILSAFKSDLRLIRGSEYLCRLPLDVSTTYTQRCLNTLYTSLSTERIQQQLLTGLRRVYTEARFTPEIIPEYKFIQTVDSILPVFVSYSEKYMILLDTLLTSTNEEFLTTDTFVKIMTCVSDLCSDLCRPVKVNNGPFAYPTKLPFSRIGHLELRTKIETLPLPQPTESCYKQKLTVYHALLVKCLKELDTKFAETLVHHLFNLPSFRSLLATRPELAYTLTPETLIPMVTEEIVKETGSLKALMEVPEVHLILRESTLVRVIKSTTPLTIPTLVSAIESDLYLIRESPEICNVPVNTVLLNMENFITYLTNNFSPETIRYKFAKCIHLVCEHQHLVIPESDIVMITTELKPVLKHILLRYMTIAETLLTNAKTTLISPELLFDFVNLLELLTPWSPPTAAGYDMLMTPVNTRGLEIPVEAIHLIHNIRLPEITETCYRQKVAVYHTILAKALHYLNTSVVDTIVEHLLRVPTITSLLSRYNLPTTTIKQVLKTELFKEIKKIEPLIEPLMEIPEVHNILLKSAVLRVIKSTTPMTIPTLVSAIESDLYLIRESPEICNVPVNTVLLSMDKLVTFLTDTLTWDKMSFKLIGCVRRTCAQLNIAIPETEIDQIMTEIRPIYKTVSTDYLTLMTTLLTNARRDTVTSEILIDLVKLIKVITPPTLYPTLTPELSLLTEPEIILEVELTELPQPTEPCYSQKVTAFHALLVEGLRRLDTKLVESITDGLIALPDVELLMKHSEYRINHNTLRKQLAEQLVGVNHNVQALWDVPELRRLLESSELLRILDSDLYTLKVILSAIRSDLRAISLSQGVCNIHMETVTDNMEHYLTSLRTIFSWETAQYKMVDVLRRLCTRHGVFIPDSQITQIVKEVAPIFKHITGDYITAVDILMPDTLNTHINTNILVNILKVIQSLKVMTPFPKVVLPETILAEVRTIHFPAVSDRCYTQKVTVVHALLVKMIESLDTQVVEFTIEQLITPELLTQFGLHNIQPETLKRHLVRTILKDIPQISNNIHEIPELNQLLKTTELFRLLRQHTKSLPTLPMILSALKTDLYNIRYNSALCDVPTDIINVNMQTVTTDLKHIFLFENMKDKMATGLREFCRTAGIALSDGKLNQLLVTIRPIYTSHVTSYLHLIDLLTPSQLDKIVTSELLVSILNVLREISELRTSETAARLLPEYNLRTRLPFSTHFETTSIYRNSPFYKPITQTLRERILREVEALRLPQPTDSCFKQKLAAYHVVLVRVLRDLEPHVVESTLTSIVHDEPALFSRLFSFLRLTPEGFLERVTRDVIERHSDVITPEMETLLKVPELRHLLEKSELVRLVTSSPKVITMETVLRCVRADVTLITAGTPELCNIRLPDTLVTSQLLLKDLEQVLTWKKMEHKLLHSLMNICAERNIHLTKDELKEALRTIRPVYESLTLTFTNVIKTLETTVNEQYINRDLLTDFLTYMVTFTLTPNKLYTPTLETQRTEYLAMTYNTMTPNYYTPTRRDYVSNTMMTSDFLITEISKLPLIRATETCYTQKVTVLRALLIKLLATLENPLMTTSLNQLRELPVLRTTLIRYGLKPEVILTTLRSTLLKDLTDLHPIIDVPELRRLLERSELLRLVSLHTKSPLTTGDLVTSLRHDLELIREESNVVCTLPVSTVNTVTTNMETFLTNLKQTFSWEKLGLKLETELLSLCRRQGLSDYILTTTVKQMVEEMRPVLMRTVTAYSATTEMLLNSIHTQQPITARLLVHVLDTAEKLLTHPLITPIISETPSSYSRLWSVIPETPYTNRKL